MVDVVFLSENSCFVVEKEWWMLFHCQKLLDLDRFVLRNFGSDDGGMLSVYEFVCIENEIPMYTKKID